MYIWKGNHKQLLSFTFRDKGSETGWKNKNNIKISFYYYFYYSFYKIKLCVDGKCKKLPLCTVFVTFYVGN